MSITSRREALARFDRLAPDNGSATDFTVRQAIMAGDLLVAPDGQLVLSRQAKVKVSDGLAIC